MTLRRHAAVVGLGFGDEGKGTVVDYLTSRWSPYGPRHFNMVVRFNGGSQAGHRVVTADGRQHVHSQFGSGFFNGTNTLLSRFTLVDPLSLISEAEHLEQLSVGSPLTRLFIEREALLLTPFHSLANKAREEARGVNRHGSCGMGIGEAVKFSIDHPGDEPLVGDVQDPKTLRKKLYALHDNYLGLVPSADMPSIDDLLDVYSAFAGFAKIVDETFLPMMMKRENVIFEGAQGVLLDQDLGTHPYTTWSRTTFSNARALAIAAGMHDEVQRIGVLRGYATRHGAGPFPTEDGALVAPDAANVNGTWQGNFRVGHLDAVLARYAADACAKAGWSVESLAVTNLDRIPKRTKVCDSYDMPDGDWVSMLRVPESRQEQETLTATLSSAVPLLKPLDGPEGACDVLGDAVRAPIAIRSHGPKAMDKEWNECADNQVDAIWARN